MFSVLIRPIGTVQIHFGPQPARGEQHRVRRRAPAFDVLWSALAAAIMFICGNGVGS